MPSRDSPQRCHSHKRLEFAPVTILCINFLSNSNSPTASLLWFFRGYRASLSFWNPFLIFKISRSQWKLLFLTIHLSLFAELWLSFWCEVHYNSLYAIEGEDYLASLIHAGLYSNKFYWLAHQFIWAHTLLHTLCFQICRHAKLKRSTGCFSSVGSSNFLDLLLVFAT